MILDSLLNTQMIWIIFIKYWRLQYKQETQNIDHFFDDMIADMLSNKKLNPVVTELFIRGWKLNIFLVFIKQY